jgi:hypothetical protein
LVKDENLLAESHNVLNKWKNYFCQQLNAHGLNDVKQPEIHPVEALLHEPNSEVEVRIEK